MAEGGGFQQPGTSVTPAEPQRRRHLPRVGGGPASPSLAPSNGPWGDGHSGPGLWVLGVKTPASRGQAQIWNLHPQLGPAVAGHGAIEPVTEHSLPPKPYLSDLHKTL